jgi:DNA polymerase
LDLELRLLHPLAIVLLGASAARAVLRRPVTIGRSRGQPIPVGNTTALVTVHPSYLLRMPDPAVKARERARFVADLRTALGIAKSA